MAGIDHSSAFHARIAGVQWPGAERLRFALALAVSAVLHVWFGTGIALEAPGRWPQPAAPALTAQLQPFAGQGELTAPPAENTVVADPVQPPPLRARARPPANRGSASEEQAERDVPLASATTGQAPGLPLPQTAGDYYAARDLDVYPALRTPLRFGYPERAARTQISGRVLAMLSIDAAGAVEDVAVVASEPQGYFDDAARAILGAARFFPARKNGSEVRSRILISLDFDPGLAEGVLR